MKNDLKRIFPLISTDCLTCFSSSPPKYHRTLTNVSGLPSLTSQKRVTLRRSISDTGTAGSILRATEGLSAEREKRNVSLFIQFTVVVASFLEMENVREEETFDSI